VQFIEQCFSSVDARIAAMLFPLSIWILISGLDDLVLDIVYVWHAVIRRSGRQLPSEEELRDKKEAPIAIFVPLWHEHRVIARMIEHNAAAIQYRNYRFFVGAYSNDEPTIAVVRDLEKRFANVHLCLVPHPGPTSKADCLNWIYEHMQRYEERHGDRFDVVMTHDAEDIVHPASLRWVNFYAATHGMVQVPVVPLPTPWWKVTHGVYCDEFSESHTKDMRVRQWTGSFVPSCGVGTGFTRTALERLAAVKGGKIFEPVCLTEDYENGLSLHLLGEKQIFVPLVFREDSFVATRELFPQTFRSAVKQRTRWVMGISLQGWERHGWQGSWVDKYWLWRDRKGLLGNPLSVLTNAISVYALTRWALGYLDGSHWTFGRIVRMSHLKYLLWATFALGVFRLIVRAANSARIYGWWFAVGAPLRTWWANGINSLAACNAIYRYARARLQKKEHVWLKTDHAYPTQAALSGPRRKLGEVLVSLRYITEAQLQQALTTKPDNLRLGRHLVKLGCIKEDQLFEGVRQQQSLPAGRLSPSEVKTNVARSLPSKVIRDWRMLPFKVEMGNLFLAGPEFPTDEMRKDLRRFTSLEIRFQLITPANFAELTKEFL
jgi:bacteriophage N4 adsorption protein B